jgi:protein-tyrosine phosphatase
VTAQADGDFTVLVVCTGNVNRSALGQVLLDTWTDWYLPADAARRVSITSAGLRAPEGSAMGRRSRTIAEALGADGSAHRARQISEAAIRNADLVLVSSARQRDDVLGLVPGALRSTFTIREAGRIASLLDTSIAPTTTEEMRARVAKLAENRAMAPATGDRDDIVDPQGRDDDAYRLMARQEVPALTAIAGLLFGMPKAEAAAYEEAVEAARFGLEGESDPAGDDERPRGRRQA